MKPFFPALLIITACLNRAERQPSSDSTSTQPARPTLALRSALPAATSDTGFWADTARVGDTVFYHRGRAITSVQVLTDSTWFQIFGIPFGLFGSWKGNTFQPNQDWATQGYGSDNASTLSGRLAYLQQHNLRMVLIPTGGARCNYLTPVCVNGKPASGSKFDMAKWKAQINTFNTPALRQTITAAAKAGTIIGASLMDEPYNCAGAGTGNAANSWGPCGTMTRARVDSLCAYAQTVFPGVPVGVFANFNLPDLTGTYRTCDFFTSQYGVRKGDMVAYRDSAVMMAKRSHMALSTALNVLDGGDQAPLKDAQGHRKTDYAATDCPLSTTGGRGTYFPNCRMTPAQVVRFGTILGSVGCFVTGFKYAADMLADSTYQAAFREVSLVLKNRPRISCFRG
jgi:hypothetical protein